MTGKHSILSLNGFLATDAQGLPLPLRTIVDRRLNNAGPSSMLFYNAPLHVVKAEGARIHTSDGRSFLDFYNNVPSVGHCNQRVADAVYRQMGLANSHSRYLYDIVEEYAERLLATAPSYLSNVTFTCTGSEANDLALRISRIVSGRHGVIVTAGAYHGNTAAVTEISPSSYKTGGVPPYVKTVAPPSRTFYGEDIAGGFANAVREKIAELNDEGFGLAAFIADSIFSSDGVFADPAGFLKDTIDVVHKSGGLFIADEVQPGFGRTGEFYWGFMRHGVEPDLVTLGKPMGNGYPLAGIVSRSGLLDELQRRFGYFNTFGGTPAAAAAGLAVLDEIAERQLMRNARERGASLKAELQKLPQETSIITDVRAIGLYLGLSVRSANDEMSASSVSNWIVQRLKDEGILIGIAGQNADTLKIRPPLIISQDECDLFIQTLRKVLLA